jgi:hypothetical protein
MLLYLSSEGADFIVLLLDHSVQPFALLAQQGDFVLRLGPQLFECAVQLLRLALVLVTLPADQLELVLQLPDLTSRQSQVLLSTTYLFSQAGIFS